MDDLYRLGNLRPCWEAASFRAPADHEGAGGVAAGFRSPGAQTQPVLELIQAIQDAGPAVDFRRRGAGRGSERSSIERVGVSACVSCEFQTL